MALSRPQKKELTKIIISAALFFLGIISGALSVQILPLILYLAAYIPVGLPVLIKSVRGIFRGNFLDENFLMAIATVGAFILGEFTEGVAVMLFYKIGELFESVAVDRSRRSISSLMELCPDTARVVRRGEVSVVSADEVAVGETIIINPGERIPLDGIITEGETTVDTAALTGESMPRPLAKGDTVLSGTVNLEGVIKVTAVKTADESTAMKILDTVENSAAKKSRREAFITRFARVYTPIVVVAAALLAIIPSLITGDFAKYIYAALNFLVISCPCALVISVPLAFFGGIGAASKNGVLIKGGNHLEALAGVKTLIFDKTGTLTEGKFTVSEVYPIDMTESELLTLAAKAESASSHPIARSICDACPTELDTTDVTDICELAGKGVICKIGGVETAVGSERLLSHLGGHVSLSGEQETVIFVLQHGRMRGTIVLSDKPKESAKEAIAMLRALSVKRCVMLTGDSDAVASKVSSELCLDAYLAELLPGDKVTAVERELKYGSAAYAGDGINDAPVLARADVGIAMGAAGSDAAIEAADVVLMDDDPRKIAFTVRLARKTVRIATENIVFALAVKGVILALGFFGIANMWLAVFADVGVAVLAILNSMRVGRI